VGSPKSAVFGGVTRARLSSQSLKRAVRLLARSESPDFQGIRSRFLLDPFTKALVAAGLDEASAAEKAKLICEAFSKVDAKKPDQVTTAVYLSPGEIKQIAAAVANGDEPKKAIKKVDRLDAADIALFGRMVANDATLNVEGATMFSHALSTHAASNEIDFFSSVDDLKGDAEDAGAGMIGTLEFNSATYYRYTAINLEQFACEKNLGKLSSDQRRLILKDFIRATLIAVPGARQNSMNAATLPFEVLGIRKDKGQPLQLANAFESPVKATAKGLQAASLAVMKEHFECMEKTWGPLGDKYWLTEIGLDSFLEQLLAADV
jgi:CRISPR system Cascade subunit CasC